MVFPPRDYPDQQPVSFEKNSAEFSAGESRLITVRSVLDRLESEQPVTDAMIHTAVTNLHTADSLKHFKKPAAAPLYTRFYKRPTLVPEALRSLLKNVTRD